MRIINKAIGCLLLAISFLLLAIPANSQELTANSQKVITRSTMIGLGTSNVLDTYLSQEHFTGPGMSFLSAIERNRTGCRWSTLMEHEANISSVKDRPDMKHEIEGAYNFYWGKLYSWQLFDNCLKLQAGGLVNASLGVIYNTSNSNNPAQARAHLNVMPTGTAAYRFQLFKRTLVARYELSLPLVGIMFSPNYGQSYYEIFSRGNYDHNIVPTTFISAPEWRHMLTIDIPITTHPSSLTLRIGYLGNMQQAKVNNLRQHIYTHRILIGFTRRFSIVNVRM